MIRCLPAHAVAEAFDLREGGAQNNSESDVAVPAPLLPRDQAASAEPLRAASL